MYEIFVWIIIITYCDIFLAQQDFYVWFVGIEYIDREHEHLVILSTIVMMLICLFLFKLQIFVFDAHCDLRNPETYHVQLCFRG